MMSVTIADAKHAAIKLKVKYLKNPSFTFLNIKQSMNGMTMKLPMVAKYDTRRFGVYNCAKLYCTLASQVLF